MMDDRFMQAKDFLHSNARLLERFLFSVMFEGAAPAQVGRLIAAYQNADGGLGHALEPDIRCPESQPLFVEFGLHAMCDAHLQDHKLALSICSFLEQVSDRTGLVPLILPSALRSAHAAHWTSVGEPGINPTAGICGLLHYQGVEHTWLARATKACCEILLQNPPRDAHGLLGAACLAEHLPDKRIAADITAKIATVIPNARFFIPFAPATKYGLTPLHFAPSPTAPLRHLFTEEQINGHLADLLSRQQEDGGWPISWEPPGAASRNEWRGIVTLQALSVLVAYGWMSAN